MMVALVQATFCKLVGGLSASTRAFGVAALPLPQMMAALVQATCFKLVGGAFCPDSSIRRSGVAAPSDDALAGGASYR